MTIEIHFGALCIPLKDQLQKQGIMIPDKDVETLQELTNAIIMLKMHGLIPDSIVISAERKVIEKIVACIREKGEITKEKHEGGP